MGLNLGDLDKPVLIQQLTETQSETGFPIEGWTTLYDQAWMSREKVRGSERYTNGQLTAPATARWVMRYAADMDPDIIDVPKKRRLVYPIEPAANRRSFDITEASHLGRKESIEILTLSKGGTIT